MIDVESPIQSCTEALEARVVDGVMRAAWGKSAGCGVEIDARVEPLVGVLASSELMVEFRGLTMCPELIARSGPNTGIAVPFEEPKSMLLDKVWAPPKRSPWCLQYLFQVRTTPAD